MRLYCTEGKYFAIKRDAEKEAREIAKNSYSDVKVEYVFVATDKSNVIRMLNVEGGHTQTLEVVYTTKGRKKD